MRLQLLCPATQLTFSLAGLPATVERFEPVLLVFAGILLLSSAKLLT